MGNLNRSWAVVVGLWAALALAQVSVPVPPDEGPLASGLSPPVLAGASNCSVGSWRVSLSGGFPGGEYRVFEEYPPGIINPLGTFPVNPNTGGVTVVDVITGSGNPTPVLFAAQAYRGIVSGYSPALTTRDPKLLPQPELPFTPLWECGWATQVAGHQPGDQVTLVSSLYGARYVIPSAFGTSEYMPVGSVPFKAGEIVVTQYSTCEGPPQVSPVSAASVVAIFTNSVLPQPEVSAESAFVGVNRFNVSGVVHGATLNVKLARRSGSGDSWSERCATPSCTVFLPSSVGQLEEGDAIAVSQELCAGSVSSEGKEEVRSCGDTPLPTLSPTPVAGDTSISLSSYPPGSVVRVYATKDANPQANQELIGYAFDTPIVHLDRAIAKDDMWIIVAVSTAACDPRAGIGVFVGRR